MKEFFNKMRSKSGFRRHLFPMLVLTLSLVGIMDNVVNAIGLNHVREEASTHLQKTEESTKHIFLLLSVAKSGMSVIESSQGGISFFVDAQVQLGGVFESLKHLIDHGWLMSLIALSVVFISKILLGYTDLALAPLLILLSSCWLIHGLCQHFSARCRYFFERILRAVIVWVVTVAVAFPIAIYGTSLITKNLTQHYTKNVNKTIADHNQHFAHGRHNEGLKESTTEAMEKYRKQRKDIREHVESMHTTIYQHVAILLLEVLILPLLLFCFVYLGSKAMTRAHQTKMMSTC